LYVTGLQISDHWSPVSPGTYCLIVVPKTLPFPPYSWTFTVITSALSAPTNLNVTQTGSNGTQTRLTWDYGGDPIDGFIVERSNARSGAWTQVAMRSQSTPFLVDESLPDPFGTYFYRVRAFKGTGESSNATADGIQLERQIPGAGKETRAHSRPDRTSNLGTLAQSFGNDHWPEAVIEVKDAGGNVVTSSNAPVTLTSNPANVSLSGAAVNGVATFSNIVFSAPGTYTLTASSPGLASGTTDPFTVTIATGVPTVGIDSPASGTVISSGTVLITGWALSNTGIAGTAIANVQVKVDGNLIGNAAYGISRPDVCATYPGRTGCPNVGYIYSASLALLSVGSHIVTVVATDNRGVPNVGSASVSVTVAPLAMPGTKVGVARAGTQFLQDTNGNGTVDAVDRNLTTFTPPGGVLPGDVPVVGDWNGDGHAKAGFYRPATGKWWLDFNNNGTFDAGDLAYSFGGLPGDLPFAGDWNAIPGVAVNKTCIGIYRANGSVWLLDLNCNGTFENAPTDAFFPFGGLAGDVPVVGNWTGGQTRVGVVRKYAPAGVPQGEPFLWVLDGGSATAGTLPENHPAAVGAFAFGGLPGDRFVSGDWLGSGTARAGIYRNGLWVLDANGLHNPDLVVSYGGVATDIALPGKW